MVDVDSPQRKRNLRHSLNAANFVCTQGTARHWFEKFMKQDASAHAGGNERLKT